MSQSLTLRQGVPSNQGAGLDSSFEFTASTAPPGALLGTASRSTLARHSVYGARPSVLTLI